MPSESFERIMREASDAIERVIKLIFKFDSLKERRIPNSSETSNELIIVSTLSDQIRLIAENRQSLRVLDE
mgnify:CR=1 FL=1